MSDSLIGNSHGLPHGGPSIAAPALWASEDGHAFSDEERALLAVIATIVRYRKGEKIFQQENRASAIFNIINGVVKSYRKLPDGRQHIVGFLFPKDLIGLSESGKYVNSADAVTDVSLYRIPTGALESRLKRYPNVDFQIIAKLCHDLREAQRHAFMLSKQRAIAKVGLFIQMLETYEAAEEQIPEEIYLPMTRSDIGAYVGISPEAVSRSFRDLVARGAIAFRDRQHVKILDRVELGTAVGETDRAAVPGHCSSAH